jgi:hypothetical protein
MNLELWVILAIFGMIAILYLHVTEDIDDKPCQCHHPRDTTVMREVDGEQYDTQEPNKRIRDYDFL